MKAIGTQGISARPKASQIGAPPSQASATIRYDANAVATIFPGGTLWTLNFFHSESGLSASGGLPAPSAPVETVLTCTTPQFDLRVPRHGSPCCPASP